MESTIDMLRGLRPRYEAHHKIKISDEALEAAAKLSQRYITDRHLPDKAIDLIDEAASKIRMTMRMDLMGCYVLPFCAHRMQGNT